MGQQTQFEFKTALRQATLSLRTENAATRVLVAFRQIDAHLRKAYDPNQPRRRDGTPQSGWWSRPGSPPRQGTTRIRLADFAARLEELGGGKPIQENSPSGATQFIFPNGMVLRFDLLPGQYKQRQEPHINIQWPALRINHHVPLR